MGDCSYARIHRELPKPLGEGLAAENRATRYGDQQVQLISAKGYGLADEGSYFVTTNPTPGTGLPTIAAPTTFSATSPFVLIYNSAAPVTGKRVYLDFLRLICTAPGTGGTALHCAVTLDANRTDKWTSGGSLLTPVNPNMDTDRASIVQVRAGALVAAAAPLARLLGHFPLRTAIPVINDVYTINFGGQEFVGDGVLVSGTAIAQRYLPHAPVVIGPGQWAAVHLWLPSQSVASSFEVELGHWER